MPLFIDVTLPRANSAELDLLQIARCDGGLGEAAMPNDNTAVQVTYEQSTSGVGQDRLKQLVTSGTNIVIHPVDSSFVFGDGTPITSVSGQTFPFDGTAIRVIYDSSWAAGSGYFVFDTALNPISFPTPVMLFHELSHAFHMDVGDIPADGPSAEFQAETDEDAFRAQVGLTARDPTNHDGGVGMGNGQVVPDCSGLNPNGGGGGGTITCFMVSAALGSPRAAAVLELQIA